MFRFPSFRADTNLSSRPSTLVEAQTRHSSSHWSSLATKTQQPQSTLTPARNSSLVTSGSHRDKLLTSSPGRESVSLSSSHNNGNNYNWSPNRVLVRSRHIQQPTPCDIITGVPLLTNRWRQETQRECREGERNAPMLTMRERHRHLKGRSRLGFSSRESATTSEGCRLVGGTAGLRPDPAYSRHSLKPMQPSSHTPIQPDQNQLSSLERGQNKSKPI